VAFVNIPRAGEALSASRLSIKQARICVLATAYIENTSSSAAMN